MALYTIGDLHLSHSVNKRMDVFGGSWVDYVDKLSAGFETLRSDDLCVICGDISWGMTLDDSLEDFKYIEKLPGKKIILKGNHDYWWTTVAKMNAFFAKHGIISISILHNNSFLYEGAAICGTRGWLSDETLTAAENEKITARETLRLRASLQNAASKIKVCQITENEPVKLCFFHYPPRFGKIVCEDTISVMNEFGVKSCRYGHLHGDGHRLAVRGTVEGIEYDIVAADYINFTPQKVDYEK